MISERERTRLIFHECRHLQSLGGETLEKFNGIRMRQLILWTDPYSKRKTENKLVKNVAAIDWHSVFALILLVDNVPVFEWVAFANRFVIVLNHMVLAGDYRTLPSFEIVVDVLFSAGTDRAVRHQAMVEYALHLFPNPLCVSSADCCQ